VKTPTQQKILHVLEKLEKQKKKVIVTGCMASANQDLIEKYAPNASIVTTNNIGKIAYAVNSDERVVFDAYDRVDKLTLFNAQSSVVAKVPVSEGCLSNCNFCETKFARGPLNSFSEDRIINAVAFSVGRGAKEIQLTSQDMGAYGLDRKTNIARLMQRLSGIGGDFKIRVGMLNPEHLGRYMDEFAAALKNDRFYKFVHLPVQSGSNRVLGDMKRRYTIEQFNERVDYLRDNVPGITIETDIIVGYPTERDEDFEMTLDFVRETKPDVVNRCKFWARPHAAASRLKQLPNEVITQRGIELTRVVRRVQKGLNDRCVGRVLDVTITEKEDGSLNARADNYKKVIIKNSASNLSLGMRVPVRIETASSNVLYGA
jgi:threonylcarbamoyladenosine tRNA methylthiotransferase CDKAL1